VKTHKNTPTHHKDKAKKKKKKRKSFFFGSLKVESQLAVWLPNTQSSTFQSLGLSCTHHLESLNQTVKGISSLSSTHIIILFFLHHFFAHARTCPVIPCGLKIRWHFGHVYILFVSLTNTSMTFFGGFP